MMSFALPYDDVHHEAELRSDYSWEYSKIGEAIILWVKAFKNGPRKICGRQSLKNFTWPILEYFVPYNGQTKLHMSLND